jgi:hypothetical protein
MPKIEVKNAEKKGRAIKATTQPSHTISPQGSDNEDYEEEADVQETDVEVSDEDYEEEVEEVEEVEEEEEEVEEVEPKGEKPKKTPIKIIKKTSVIKRARAPTSAKPDKGSSKVSAVI